MKDYTFHAIGTLVVLSLTSIHGLAQSSDEPYTFTTLAGGGGFIAPSQPGTAARLSNPAGVATDNAGNVFVCDTFNNVIRKVTPDGVVRTLAGLPGTSGSADGTGGDARFFNPDKLALDSAGNIYVSDNGNNTIRRVTPDGVVTTLAGRPGVSGSADGMNSAARFLFPEGVAVDNAGNVFVADSGNSTIRKLAPVGTNWVVTTVAGKAGSIGAADGTNAAARFNWLQGLTIDSAGNLYVADTDNHNIRKVTPVGANWVVTTLAGNASIKNQDGNPVGAHADGTNRTARFNEPKGISVDKAGNIYVADEGNHTLRQVAPMGTDWVVTTIAGLASNPGSADGANSAARFDLPYDVAADNTGNLYVADLLNDAVRKLTPTGTNWVATTLAGAGGISGGADGAGNAALFRGPAGVAVDGAGNVYVADQVNHTIRKVTAAGEVTTVAGLAGYAGSANGTDGNARFNCPSGVALDSAGRIFVVERGNGSIRKATLQGANWVVTTLATGFTEPKGLAVDGAGNVYVTDSLTHTLRKVTPTGVVTTLAGTEGRDGSANGTGAAARFNYPTGLAVDSATNIYVADSWNHTIRKVTPARVVTTIAGLAGDAGSTDGIGSAARFNHPSGIAVDSAGNVFVADAYNNAIRKLIPAGTNWVVTTPGGRAGIYGTADGTGSAARFGNPNGVAIDSAGNLYAADFYFNTIRKAFPAPRILNPGFHGSRFAFDLTGPNGRSVVVDASADLVNWSPVWTNTFGAGAVNFIGPQGDNISNRYYRTRLP